MLRTLYNLFFIAGNDRRCSDLLRRLLRNPPNNTKIAINIGLSKARYLCREGFKLVGMEIRTCKAGKWKENVEPKCLSKLRWELKFHVTFPILNYLITRVNDWTIFAIKRTFDKFYFCLWLSRGIRSTGITRMYWSIRQSKPPSPNTLYYRKY